LKGLFVTGTDTGVGKTFVTATLCRILRERGIDAVAIKPFATGLGPDTNWRDNDPLILAAAMDFVEPAEVISPVRLSAPLSPYDAARINGTGLDVEAIIAAIEQIARRHQFALVEGVGGVAVPLTPEVMVSDFAKQLELGAVVVARSQVGTINHTLLTTGALREAGVRVEGIVFNRPCEGELTLAEKVGPETACRFARVACFGLVNRCAALDEAPTIEEAVKALPTTDKTLNAVADHVLSNLA